MKVRELIIFFLDYSQVLFIFLILIKAVQLLDIRLFKRRVVYFLYF